VLQFLLADLSALPSFVAPHCWDLEKWTASLGPSSLTRVSELKNGVSEWPGLFTLYIGFIVGGCKLNLAVDLS
jgi:hypothetical protein